jgi:glycosyltransferase involved in cell wall biosynthesis
MSRPPRIAILNEVWPDPAASPDEVLDRAPTLTGWADAIVAAGAEVCVLQRFSTDAEITRGVVHYRLRSDRSGSHPDPRFGGNPALQEIAASWHADVVHVNGLDYPRSLRRLRRRLASSSVRRTTRHPAVVVQDHGGFDPRELRPWRRLWLRSGLRAAAALLVATPPQIALFESSGLVPENVRLFDVMEGSTTLRVSERRQRRGDPALLWVGRLNGNKDPLTVLAGFAQFAIRHPQATLTFVYQDAGLEPALRAAIARDDRLAASVVLRGAVAHDHLAAEYAAADLFVLGSHREGSGYAAIEALACGVPPVVPDIPSFRWITDGGAIGGLWNAGDAASLAAALERVVARPLEPQRQACRRRFDAHFSWTAIGRRALAIYEELSRA